MTIDQSPPITDLAERCFDVDMRVDRITHLAVVGGDDMDYEMFEYLTERCGAVIAEQLGLADAAALHASIGEFGDEPDARKESFSQTILWKPLRGFLVAASQPVFTKTKSGHLMFSWGYYDTRVFYAETYDDALELAFTWATERQEAARNAPQEPDGVPGD